MLKRRALYGVLMLLLVAAGSLRAQPTLVGEELFVSSPEEIQARHPDLQVLPDGGALLAWDDDLRGVVGRFLSPTGEGSEVVLAAIDPAPSIPFRGAVSEHREPAVVLRPDGGFLLVWAREELDVSYFPFYQSRKLRQRSVVARSFDATGQPQDQQMQVSGGGEAGSLVAAAVPGGALVVWAETLPDGARGIYCRRLDAAGSLLGEALRVDAGEGTDAAWPALAVAPNGDLLVAWEACCDGGGDVGIRARLLTLDGGPQGPAFEVNGTTAGHQRAPAVAADGERGFLVAWQSPTGEVRDGRGEVRIFAQRVRRDGLLEGAESRISSGFGWGHSAPVLTAMAPGRFAASWLVWNGDFRVAVMSVAVGRDAEPQGPPLQVSQQTIGAQSRFTAAATPGGEVLVAWKSFDEAGRHGLAVRRLRFDEVTSPPQLREPLKVWSGRKP